MSGKIRIITVVANESLAQIDRGGGQEHGLVSRAISSAAESVDADKFLAQLDDAIDKVRAIAERVKTSAGEFEVDEITIGLAISGEGSIGIATASAEASIEIALKRRIKNSQLHQS